VVFRPTVAIPFPEQGKMSGMADSVVAAYLLPVKTRYKPYKYADRGKKWQVCFFSIFFKWW
jgi:hypothetical protein